jgi:hypothetical protein
MKLKHALILLTILNFTELPTACSQSDTICFDREKAKKLIAGYAEVSCMRVEVQAAIIDLNRKDKKIAKRNTAIIILSSVVMLLTGVIAIK